MPLSRVQVSPLSVRVTGWLTVTLATFGSAADVCATAPDDNTADRVRNAELTRTRELDINATLSNNPRGATIALGPAVRYWLAERWVISAVDRLGCTFSRVRSEEHTSELQSLRHLVCRLLLE